MQRATIAHTTHKVKKKIEDIGIRNFRKQSIILIYSFKKRFILQCLFKMIKKKKTTENQIIQRKSTLKF